MPLLRILEGSGAGLAVEIGPGPLTIGREHDNALRIEDPKSSRYHAEIAEVAGVWTLRDLGSSNGTWTEAGKVDTLALPDGAVFRIGRTFFRFESGGTARRLVGVATLGDDQRAWTDPEVVEGLPPAGGSDLFRLRHAPAELERQNAYLLLLHGIIERSRATRGRDQLFELLDDAAAEVLEGDRCAVFLPADHAGDGWALWPAHEKRLRARYGNVPFARTLLRAVRSRQEPLLCTLSGDLSPSASMLRAGVKSAMAAPLRLGGEVQALLYVDRIRGLQAFHRQDLEFLAAAANQLAVTLANHEKVAGLEAEVERLHAAPVAEKPLELVGAGLAEVDALLARLAPLDAAVAIAGEAGSGKELCARLLHRRSRRASAPLQILSCAGLDPVAQEVALFGCAAGAAPGVDDHRPGIYELAHGATLLLDEIGELAPPLQARLADALERGSCCRRGDPLPRAADVRLVVLTTRDLAEEVRGGRFRPELWARLESMLVAIPPLRERPGDIDLTADWVLREWAARNGEHPRRLAPEARTRMLRATWPGNVRQLKLALERASVCCTDQVIRAQDLPAGIGDLVLDAETTPVSTPMIALAAVERAHILRVLDHCGGNKKAAAEVLGIDRSTLYAKLRVYGVK
jgi:two-component system response regulator HydG